MSRLQTVARALAPAVAIAAALTCGGRAAADSLPKMSEGFEANTLPAGWTRINNSSGNVSSSRNWFKVVSLADDPLPFDAEAGSVNSYFQANIDSTTSFEDGTISNWLIGPSMEFANGDTISFFTRTASGSNYPDRLQLRFGQGLAPTPAARPLAGFDFTNGDADVGDFTTVLVEVNPNLDLGGYPEDWTEYSFRFTGLSGPTTGKFAFRYFVTDAGQFDDNANVVGVDTVTVTAAVPEPAAYLMMALGMGVIGLRRMRATRG